MRVLYFGTRTTFSLSPLQALLNSRHKVVGVVVPDKHGDQIPPEKTTLITLPTISAHINHTIITTGWEYDIPVFGFKADLPAADVIVVACFPSRLPLSILQHPQRAALNIHPSWLPDYRGPAPVFWQLRDGLTTLGVTLHHMGARLDQGDIVAQTHVPLPTGISGPEIDRLLSETGVRMLLDALDQGDLHGTAQSGGSYQSWPHDEHWHIPTTWNVQRAFNFMRAVAEWGRPFTLPAGDSSLRAWHARRYIIDASAARGDVRREPDGQALGFADGWLVIE